MQSRASPFYREGGCRYLLKWFTEENLKNWAKFNDEVINIRPRKRSLIHSLCCPIHETWNQTTRRCNWIKVPFYQRYSSFKSFVKYSACFEPEPIISLITITGAQKNHRRHSDIKRLIFPRWLGELDWFNLLLNFALLKYPWPVKETICSDAYSELWQRS